MDRPSPVPLPTSFVVKNGSKTRARVSSSMPVPVSDTRNTTPRPASSEPVFSVSTRTTPPSGIASRAFSSRFKSTCSSCVSFARTGAGTSSSRVTTSTFERIRFSIVVHARATTALMSINSEADGLLWLKASSRLVMPAARSTTRQRSSASWRRGSPRSNDSSSSSA